MGLGKPGIAGRDAAACPETQGFGLAETSKPLRAGPFTLRACKIPGIREMARRAKPAAAAGFEDSEGFCKSLDFFMCEALATPPATLRLTACLAGRPAD